MCFDKKLHLETFQNLVAIYSMRNLEISHIIMPEWFAIELVKELDTKLNPIYEGYFHCFGIYCKYSCTINDIKVVGIQSPLEQIRRKVHA